MHMATKTMGLYHLMTFSYFVYLRWLCCLLFSNQWPSLPCGDNGRDKRGILLLFANNPRRTRHTTAILVKSRNMFLGSTNTPVFLNQYSLDELRGSFDVTSTSLFSSSSAL
mmetsp:Transcript_24583/g.52975  ORF Transcript_24583/g.52975 Transcript_24583/m.52975 type:complete len:111 (+) Transcript_24583:267-599(+)